ncbi:MAG: YcxB family protein [Lachnospiraceae bacterium]|nr:YcxB family protein [Lachnospiraceae bacterium]
METEFDVKITVSALFDYKMQVLYRQPVTIIMTAIGCLMIYGFITMHQWYYPVIAAILILYPPIDMLRLSVMQAKMVPAFKNGMHYKLSAEGVLVRTGEEEQLVPWENCIKATGSRSSYFIFTGKKNAFILPRADMKEKTEDVLRIISANMAPEKVKIRY